MSAIFVPAADCRVVSDGVMTEPNFRRTQRIHWKNVHTTRLQQAVGDDKLVCGFDHAEGVWLLAYLRPRTIIGHYGMSERVHQETVPIVFHALRDDDTGEPVPIDDPRIVPALMRADTYRHGSMIDAILAEQETEAKQREEKRAADARARAAEIWPTVSKWLDEIGVTKGPREGEAGSRRHFYQDCLQKG